MFSVRSPKKWTSDAAMWMSFVAYHSTMPFTALAHFEHLAWQNQSDCVGTALVAFGSKSVKTASHIHMPKNNLLHLKMRCLINIIYSYAVQRHLALFGPQLHKGWLVGVMEVTT